ncbi:FAD-binding oxidoreductase [Actinoplanes bogorensis]|uniref:FAD-binding oxidoreductase n=2 Tax=Paractinoplanes bogorensis TaxID=1610840 RepID=A0ABS5Z3W9_9ACTN|nr:FAD-binding oxidoreductase [Actinoplanes bogorensis]
MADKQLDSLTLLAGPRVGLPRKPSRFDDLPAGVEKLEPGDHGYRGRSSTYMRGGRPALILRPRTPDEVAGALAFAKRHPELQLGLRSAGHGVSGRSTNTGGLIIDVGAMNEIEYDEDRGILTTGPGATWKQVAAVLDKYDLALGSGDYGGVGVGGLATAGGIGFLSREQGLTIDRLRAVELVLADGRRVRASADENPELFWAVQGAGANFGVATSFEFEAGAAGEVGWAQFALVSQDLVTSLTAYGEIARNAPRDTTVFWLTGPPRSGQSVIQMYGLVNSGDPDTIIERLTPFATTAMLAQQQVVVARYADVMAQAGDVGSEGHHGRGEPVSRSGFLPRLTEEFARDVEALLRTGQTFFFQLRHMGGAIADVPSGATAFAHRTPEFSVTAIGADRDGLDEAWDRLMAPHFDGLYLSFETDRRPERLHDAFPPATLSRLRELKRRYDPQNLFQDNFNIDPSADSRGDIDPSADSRGDIDPSAESRGDIDPGGAGND